MADSLQNPRYKGVFDAYRQVWKEEAGLGKLRNFYRVSLTQCNAGRQR